MLIADSEHRKKHVLRELQLYHKMVTPGSYFIVEDGAYPIIAPGGVDDGPKAAIQEFLTNHPQFEHDLDCEQFLMSFNKGGYLRRKR
jgi:cephalosporin hydroxylase